MNKVLLAHIHLVGIPVSVLAAVTVFAMSPLNQAPDAQPKEVEISKVVEKIEASVEEAPVEVVTPSVETTPAPVEAAVVEEAPAEVVAPSVAEAPVVVEAPVIEEVPAVDAIPVLATTEVAPLKQVMVIRGVQYAYADMGQGSGQAFIDQDPSHIATWGGQAVNSVSDNLSTHFIGHNVGAFNVVLQLGVGETISVYDAYGQHRVYTIVSVFDVDDRAFSADGVYHWGEITGVGNTEQIVLQTCINDDYNRIVFAQ